jgi:hypothetical protein
VTLGPDFGRALVFAAEKHASQKRKGSDTPYVGHLLAVSAIVIEAGGTETEAIAALLHDVVEDQGASLEELSRTFSPVVAGIVDECSEDKGDGKRPWFVRKTEYLDHLRVASPSALLVSLADKIHNARSIVHDQRALGDEVWNRFNPRADQLWYYPRLVEEFDLRATELGNERLKPLVIELQSAVDELVAALPGAPHPIPGSYWVMPQLLAGEYPGAVDDQVAASKLSALDRRGIDLFVDLSEEGEYGLRPYAGLLDESSSYLRMPIRDVDVPTGEEMLAILDTIDKGRASGRIVYVHCFGGIGRTGTVVGCYLVRHGMSGEAALARIAELRRATPDRSRVSPETDEQRSMVLGWAERRS